MTGWKKVYRYVCPCGTEHYVELYQDETGAYMCPRCARYESESLGMENIEYEEGE